MPAIAINRLRVRGPPERAARSAFLIEDACRTELADSERLILVRRMELGGGAVAAAHAIRRDSIRRAYQRATCDSRHGGDEAAERANCVWFASRAEARQALLRALLAGRRPTAWYWRLAVPEWHGQPLDEWLGRLLDSPECSDADQLDLVVAAVEAGEAEAVLRALVLAEGGREEVDLTGPNESEVMIQQPAVGSQESPKPMQATDPGRTAARLRARLPPRLVAAAEKVARAAGVRSRAGRALLERMLVKASPSLALSPSSLAELARNYAESLEVPAFRSPADEPRSAESSAQPQTPLEPVAKPAAPKAHAPPAETGMKSAAAPASAHLPVPRPEPVSAPEAPPSLAWLPHEHESPAAGLWLVLPSLIRLGLREWLSQRPDLLAADAGRVLLRSIAQHHRVASEDAALTPLDWPDEPFVPPDWAQPWRTGLDRWLRRRTGLSLARLVWKAGWLRFGDGRLTVRFLPDSVDLRIRRQALDVDPGWTDWLGLSVRYLYAERMSS